MKFLKHYFIFGIFVLTLAACGQAENDAIDFTVQDNKQNQMNPATTIEEPVIAEPTTTPEVTVTPIPPSTTPTPTPSKEPKPKAPKPPMNLKIPQLRPHMDRFVPKKGFFYNFYAELIPAPTVMVLKSNHDGDCSHFPNGYETHPELDDFGVCISSPLPEQEYAENITNLKVEGKIHGEVLSDLQVRVQNLLIDSQIFVKNFDEVTYSPSSGNFSAQFSLAEAGTYAITVTATQFAEDVIADPEPKTVINTIFVHRVTPPEFTIVSPEDGAKLHSQIPVPIQIKITYPKTMGVPQSEIYVNNQLQEDTLGVPNGQGLMNGQVLLPHGQSFIKIVLKNKGGAIEKKISVYNDLKGPTLSPLKGCFNHYYMSENSDPIEVDFQLKVTDDAPDTYQIVAAVNGKEKPNSICHWENNNTQVQCNVPLKKPGMNIVAFKIQDSAGNESEYTKACALIQETKPIKAALENNSLAFTNDALQLSSTTQFITEDITEVLGNYVNSQDFRKNFHKLLGKDLPSIGIYPYSKGNTSIDIDPETLDLGTIDVSTEFDVDAKTFKATLDINKLKGKMALTTFYVKMYEDSDWPDLDDCGHPIPLSKAGTPMYLPGDPSKKDQDNICELNWDPDFAGNHCDYKLNGANKAEVNKQCFLKLIDKQKTHLILNFDHLVIPLTIKFKLSDTQPKIQVEITRASVADHIVATPKDSFIKADPDYNGGPIFDDPFTQLIDIREEFLKSIVDMLTKDTPFQINSFLKKPVFIEQKVKILGQEKTIRVGVDLANTRLALFKGSNDKGRIGLSLALASSGTASYLNDFIKDAENRAKANQDPAIQFLDPNGTPFNANTMGPFVLRHSSNPSFAQLLSGKSPILATGLSENGINQILFGVITSGLLDIPFGPKLIEENGLELPAILQPNAGALLGSDFRRSDHTLITDDTTVFTDIKPTYALPITARLVSVDDLPADAKLKTIEGLDAILEIGIGELNLHMFEADSTGHLISQPGGSCEPNNDPSNSNCIPLVRMHLNALIYGGVQLINTADSPSGKLGLVDASKQPLTFMITFDNIASRVDVATIPGTNTFSNRSDHEVADKLENLIRAALKEKRYEEETQEFEGGFSPLEIPFSPLLFDKNQSTILNGTADNLGDLLENTGISSLELQNIIISPDLDTGMLKFYLDPVIN